MNQIKPFDFGTSLVTPKVPFEIRFIAEFASSHNEIEIRYKGFGSAFVETDNFNLFIALLKKNRYFLEDFKKATFENLEPCFKSYEEGFNKGYQQFADTIRETTALFANDNDNTAKKIFEYITQPTSFLTVSYQKKGSNLINVLTKKHFFENGIKAGEKFRAWHFIIDNSGYFTNLFRKHKPFIAVYRKQYEYWKKIPGGEGIEQRLKKLLDEIDKSNGTGEDGKPSKLTHLLQLYYEKGGKPLKKQQVEKLATEKKITKLVLLNRWNDLKADSYQHNGNVNNAKEFIKSYQLLMQVFKDNNETAFHAVKNHYDQLKETYPDLTY